MHACKYHGFADIGDDISLLVRDATRFCDVIYYDISVCHVRPQNVNLCTLQPGYFCTKDCQKALHFQQEIKQDKILMIIMLSYFFTGPISMTFMTALRVPKG